MFMHRFNHQSTHRRFRRWYVFYVHLALYVGTMLFVGGIPETVKIPIAIIWLLVLSAHAIVLSNRDEREKAIRRDMETVRRTGLEVLDEKPKRTLYTLSDDGELIELPEESYEKHKRSEE